MSTRKTRLPAVDLSGIKDPFTKRALSSLLERQDAREGNRPNANNLDVGLTWRDLVDMGVVKISKLVNRAGPGVEYANPGLIDFTTPPAPTNVTTAGALANVIISWDRAGFSSYAYTEILRQAAKDAEGNYVQSDPGQAVAIGTAVAPMYVDNIGASGSYYYWARFYNQAGLHGPLNAVAGTLGETGDDPAYMLEVLTGEITESQLYAALNTRIDLIDAPTTGLVTRTSALESEVATIQSELAEIAGALPYDTVTNYITGNFVTYNDGLYRALQDMTAPAPLPTDTDYWEKVGDYGSLGDAVAAHSVILDDHETRVTTAEGSISTHATQISSLQSGLTDTQNDVSTNATAISGLDTRVSATEDGITSQATDLTRLTAAATDHQDALDQQALSEDDLGAAQLEALLLENEATNTNRTLKYRMATAESEITTLVTDLAAEAAARLLLAAEVADGDAVNAAAIMAEQVARADAVSAEAAAREALAAQVNDETTGLAAAHAAVVAESLTRATETGALSQDITTLQTSVGENTASIQEQAQSIDGLSLQYTLKFDNNGYMAGFGLASEPIDGVPFSQFQFLADRFAVINPNTAPLTVTITRSGTTATATCSVAHGLATGEHVVITGAEQREYNGSHQITVISTTKFTFTVPDTVATPATIADGFSAIKAGKASIPFIVQDGKVYMDTALIKEATITDAMIGSVAADKLTVAAGTIAEAIIGAADIQSAMIKDAAITTAKIGDAAITTAKIGDAAITTAKIGDAQITTAKIADTIQSTNYSSGSAGWKIWKNGEAEFNGVVISRPNIVAYNTYYPPDEWHFTSSYDGWSPSAVTFVIDTGYDDITDIWYSKGPGFVARVLVATSEVTGGTDTKLFDVTAIGTIGVQAAHYLNSVGPANGRIVIHCEVPLPIHIRSGAKGIKITSIKWGLVRLT